jgi:GNAT superfamily N-acetyltransferase
MDSVLDIAVAAWAPIFAAARQDLGSELFELFHSDWQSTKKRNVRDACRGVASAMVCVAETDGRVVGFASYYARAARQVGVIGNNAVHPGFQGRGIAPRMYEYVLERLRGLGMRGVTVETGGDDSHAPARRAYAKVGFQAGRPAVRYYREL